MSYVGHGGAVWSSSNVLASWDAALLRAQSHQPVLLTMDCLNGYFVAPNLDALPEELLKAEGRGAGAAFSPSGLSLDGPAHEYHRAVMAELASRRHERLGASSPRSRPTPRRASCPSCWPSTICWGTRRRGFADAIRRARARCARAACPTIGHRHGGDARTTPTPSLLVLELLLSEA